MALSAISATAGGTTVVGDRREEWRRLLDRSRRHDPAIAISPIHSPRDFCGDDMRGDDLPDSRPQAPPRSRADYL